MKKQTNKSVIESSIQTSQYSARLNFVIETTSTREGNQLLYRIAADAEAKSPDGFKWVIVPSSLGLSRGMYAGCIKIEYAFSSNKEKEAALALLNTIKKNNL